MQLMVNGFDHGFDSVFRCLCVFFLGFSKGTHKRFCEDSVFLGLT